MAHAQSTPIKFQLDWRFEGPAALFLQPVAKGHFKAAGLDVTVDAGNGSGGAVQRVASGTYDMGFADLAAVMEFHANNPDAQNKPVAVMMVYNNTPASVMALKKSGITKPADLAGKSWRPVFDAGRRAFPIFQKANGIGAVTWTAMDRHCAKPCWCAATWTPSPASPSPRCSTWRRAGAKAADVVVLPYADFGVKLYGNVIIASPKLIKENPAAIKAFLSAFTKGAKVIANPLPPSSKGARWHRERAAGNPPPAAGHRHRHQQPRRARRGFGKAVPGRLSLMASQVSDAFNTKTRVNADDVWNPSFLPSTAELNILAQEVILSDLMAAGA